MPREESVSDIFKKLGNQAKKVHDKVVGKPVVIGNIQLPPGIEGGRAKLVDVKLGTFKVGDNKGKPFFMAQAMVLSPTHHNGIKCEGLRTIIGPEPLCDTPNSNSKRKTFEDHYDWVLNALKMLGMPNDTDFDEVPDFIETIKEEEPVILFRTWQGRPSKEYPDPKVNHEWNGLADSNGEVSVDDEIKDDSGDGEGETFNEFPEEEGDIKPPKGKKTSTSEDDDDGLYPLAEKADKGDKAAKNTLTAHALEHGMTKKEIEDTANWMMVVDKIRDAQNADSGGEDDEPDEDAESSEETGEEEEPEEAEAAVPANDEVWLYRPVDPKTRKPVKKPIEGIVSKVNLKKGTCNWQNMTTNKTLTDVPLKALIEVEE